MLHPDHPRPSDDGHGDDEYTDEERDDANWRRAVHVFAVVSTLAILIAVANLAVIAARPDPHHHGHHGYTFYEPGSAPRCRPR